MSVSTDAPSRRRVGRAQRLQAASRGAEGAVWEGRRRDGTRPVATGPLVIACGALAAELRLVLDGRLDLLAQAGSEAVDHDDAPIDIEFLPANLHSRPDRIVPSLRPRLAEAVAAGRQVFVAYADCGTGGQLDALLSEYPGVERLPGAHCYETFAGAAAFAALAEAELGTLYLTDFLAKHFDAVIWGGLGLDRHPELLTDYFGSYRRVVLLSQQPTEAIVDAARAAADRLGLEFHHHPTGLQSLVEAVPVSLRRRDA